MWKHKNFINLQLCGIGEPVSNISIFVNGNSVTLSNSAGSTWQDIAYYNSEYTISGNAVVWNDGTILQYNNVDVLPTDNIISNGQYTTRAATPTLTFKHFYDAGTIGTGTYKFRHYSQSEPTPPTYTDCLTFTGETSEFTLKATNKAWDGTLEWSTDHTNWTTLAGTEAMQSVDKKLYLRGKGNTKFYISSGVGYPVRWRLSAQAGCSGNIQTLLDWENPPISISETHLYFKMFEGCTSLTTAPELPATTLATRCYYEMFKDCTSLTTAPNLPATTLKDDCYSGMFRGCTSLTSAPNLPATTLAAGCYYYMFDGCTKLKVNTSSGNKIFTCPSNVMNYTITSMFADTGGTFTGTPTAGTTYYWTE